MDKLSKIGLTVFFLFLLGYSTTSSALGLPQAKTVYTACLECSDDRIQQEIRFHYQDILASSPPDQCSAGSLNQPPGASCIGDGGALATDDWVYFTDVGAQKGVKFRGELSSSGLITIYKSYLLTPKDVDYFQQMTEFRQVVIQAKKNIEQDLASLTGVNKAQNIQRLKVYQDAATNDEGAGASGQCLNNSPFSSPMDYLKGSGVIVENSLRATLNTFTPETVARLDSLNFSLSGRNISLGVRAVFEHDLGEIRVNYENGGYLIFDITSNTAGGSFSFNLNLNTSMIGVGVASDNGNGSLTPMSTLPLSSIVHSDGQGGFALSSRLNIVITDPCMIDDFNAVLTEIGVKPQLEPGFSSDIGQGCMGATYQRDTEITWFTISQRVRMVGHRLIIYGMVTTHHLSIENGSTANFNAICGDVPISNGGGG